VAQAAAAPISRPGQLLLSCQPNDQSQGLERPIKLMDSEGGGRGHSFTQSSRPGAGKTTVEQIVEIGSARRPALEMHTACGNAGNSKMEQHT
jgi:hypothetical protein